MVSKNKKPGQQVKPICVVVGKDDFLVNAECEKLLVKLMSPEERTTGLFNADPDKVTAADILDELRTLPFFGPRRVVLVKGADEFVSKNRPLLEKYFDNPSSCSVLILTVSTWPKNTKLAGKLSKTGLLISSAILKPWQLPKYLIGYARNSHNKTLSSSAAELLVELAGDDPGRLCSEVDKLAIFTESDKAITASHIEKLIGHNRLFDAFEVIAAMTAGKTGTAVERLRNMFAVDKNAGYTIVGAFAFHFRRMFSAAALLEKGSLPGQVASQLRIWRDKESFFKQVRALGLVRLGSMLKDLAKTDYEIKTGQTTPDVAIER